MKNVIQLTKFLEQDVLEPLVGDKLHPGVEDGEHVVGVLVAGVPGGGGGEGGGPGLQEGLHLPQVLALLQQRDRVVLAPDFEYGHFHIYWLHR